MAVRRINMPKGEGAFLSAGVINRLLDSADGKVVLLYLYLQSQNGELDERDAAARLQMSPDEIIGALDRMVRLGLIEKAGAIPAPPPERADVLPEYTAKDVADAIKTDGSFQYLLDFTQKKLGKLLSTVDTQTLLGIYSWLGLPVDVICLLITSCVGDTQKKYGEGRVPTMRSIEKRARSWVSLGITTHAEVEEYLKERERRGSKKAQIARLLHIGGRPLSTTEENYISSWVDIRISEELLLHAYDITVVKTGSLRWKYMDTILKSWVAKGFKTVEQVEKGDRPQGAAGRGEGRVRQSEIESSRRLRELNRARRGEGK